MEEECFVVFVAISWNSSLYVLFVYPSPNRGAVKSGGEEKVSTAGGCFFVLDCDLLLLVPSQHCYETGRESTLGRKEFQDKTDQTQTFRR